MKNVNKIEVVELSFEQYFTPFWDNCFAWDGQPSPEELPNIKFNTDDIAEVTKFALAWINDRRICWEIESILPEGNIVHIHLDDDRHIFSSPCMKVVSHALLYAFGKAEEIIRKGERDAYIGAKR